MYEKLYTTVLDKHFRDFSACEGEWQEVSEEIAKVTCEAAYDATLKMGRPRLYLMWETAERLMKEGKVISLPFGFLRLKTDLPKCPRCGGSIPEGTAALSRIDNATSICSDCGMKEALEDWSGFRGD